MRKNLVLAVLLTLTFNASAQTKWIGTFRFVTKKGSDKATLVLKTKAFDRSKHKVRMEKDGDGLVTMIDGRTAYGTDASIPGVEIESLKLHFNGREIPIPRKLYSDCFNPSTEGSSLAVKFSDDSQSVFVFMHGGDGAGVYDVIWVLRMDGRHSRFTNVGGDCGLFNFDCGLTRD